ncbi:hypothetical protein CsatB_001658 [Cannabis sativa]
MGNHQNAFAGFPTTPASNELRPMVHFTPAKLYPLTAPLTQVPINKPLQHSVAMNHSTSQSKSFDFVTDLSEVFCYKMQALIILYPQRLVSFFPLVFQLQNNIFLVAFQDLFQLLL